MSDWARHLESLPAGETSKLYCVRGEAMTIMLPSEY